MILIIGEMNIKEYIFYKNFQIYHKSKKCVDLGFLP